MRLLDAGNGALPFGSKERDVMKMQPMQWAGLGRPPDSQERWRRNAFTGA